MTKIQFMKLEGAFILNWKKSFFISQSQFMKKQQHVSSNLEFTRVQEVSSNQKAADDSTSLFLKFHQHNLKRIKDDNKRLLQKNTVLQAQIRRITLENDQIRVKSVQNQGKVSELRNIIQKMKKDATEKKQKVQISQKSIEQMKVFQIQYQNMINQMKYQLNALKEQLNKVNIVNLDLIKELESKRKLESRLNEEIAFLNGQIRNNLHEYSQRSSIYQEKIKFLEKQIEQMRVNIQDLIVQLKIYESQKDVEKLLLVENRINERILKEHKNLFVFENQSPSKISELQTFNRLERIGKITHTAKKQNNFNDRSHQTFQKDEQELKELIQLLKQKNKILQSNLQEKEKRNKTLQNIICNQMKI